ncbi:unnamed protein product [Mytilus coruscus]|uniref:Integrase zinc-binding domain-containing protein n=1 Tax=Mytilus coruscus TaxID=42192 RepID=A0A6J8EGI9_MYTCO|nr:unnamed protein product [Mytilus coruscus]
MSCSVNAISKGNNNPSKSSELPDITQSNWVEQWDNEEILRLQQEDSNLGTVMQFLKNGNEKPVVNTPNQELSALLRQWDILFTQYELLYRKFYEIDGSITNQLVAPRELRKEIMQQLHNNRTASHLGREKTLLKVRSRFYWPLMTSDVARWCQTCPSLLRNVSLDREWANILCNIVPLQVH